MGGPAHQAALLSGRRFFPDRYETLLVHGVLAPGEESLAVEAKREGARTLLSPNLTPQIRPAADLRALAGLVALIRRFRPHVIHTHTAKAGFLGRQAALLTPGVRPKLIHTYHGHVLEGYFGPAKTAVYRGLERRLGRPSDALIGVSQATVDDLVRLRIAPRSRFRVIPLGLDLDRFAADRPELRESTRAGLGLAPDDVLCTFVGRIVAIKRVELLLEAFARAKHMDPRLQLALVGDGESRGDLEDLATSLGIRASTHFLGYERNLVPIWSATDVAVLSSANEGTPVSLIEAASAGVPAVATDVGGVRETLAAEASVIVPSGDAEALADGILRYAADSAARSRAGAAARAFALGRFGAPRLIGDIDALYREVTGWSPEPSH